MKRNPIHGTSSLIFSSSSSFSFRGKEKIKEMKISLKFREENHQQNPLLKAKLPITILNLPFVSTVVAGDASDLSFNLSTNFASFPCLKFSYSPTSTASSSPFSLSLKSGTGLFGSPHNSPLVISANMNLFSYAKAPTFFLHVKPQFGNFSLHKLTHSSSSNGSVPNVSSKSIDGWSEVSLESTSEKIGNLGGPSEKSNGLAWGGLKIDSTSENLRGNVKESVGFVWKDLNVQSISEKVENLRGDSRDGMLSGVKVRAMTELPLTLKWMVNLRWGLNIPPDVGKRMPYLTLNKIAIHKVQEVKEEEKQSSEINHMQLLKGMYSWMSRDLEVLRKENKELKQSLEEIRVGISSGRKFVVENDSGRNKSLPPPRESSSEFERWKSKRSNVDDSNLKELKKMNGDANSLESELEKAIKAASY